MSVYIMYISLVAGVSKLKSLGYVGHGRSWMGVRRIWHGVYGVYMW